MKQIELTQGLYTLVDDEDYDLLVQYNWHANYDVRANRWRAMNRTVGQMHRFLLGINEYDILVGHRNNNTLDNRRENLIVTTKSSIMIQSKKELVKVSFEELLKAVISGKQLSQVNILVHFCLKKKLLKLGIKQH